MKVSLSWLKSFLDFDLPPPKIAESLTLAGLEVEGIISSPLAFSGVVVASILEVEKHPNADRLRVATVSDGTESFQIVCGAPNCRPGIKTALAKIGATLKDASGKEFKIKRTKLRDVESCGMLCSSQELMLDGDFDGIMELPDNWKTGEALESFFGDTIFEIALTPNLGHCMSIYGIARELASILDLPLKPFPSILDEASCETLEKFRVDLIDKRQCLRYACRLSKKIQVAPSPEWMRKRLESCGIRSINNVVDIGNYVMLELGQPLHLFDADKISGGRVIITSQTEHRYLTTLDGISREIHPESLLICDEQKPLAFAGVMGGESSAVTENTCNVLIEAADFTPSSIRKTSKLLGLKSDSSQRFERGIDFQGVIPALNRAAFLLQECAGAKIASELTDEMGVSFHLKKITCRIERVNTLLGTTLSLNEVSQILLRLQCRVIEETAHSLTLAIPSFRNDLLEEIDLIEEIARIYGYNNIPRNPPRHIASTIPPSPMYLLEKAMRTYLIAEGLQECITCNLISPNQAEKSIESSLPKDSLIHVLQPSSIDQSVLRASLIPGLLQVIQYNLDHFNPTFRGFEIGRIHFKEKDLFKEFSSTGILLTGMATPYHFDPKPREADFFDLKGIIENILARLHIADVQFSPSHLHHFHPTRQASIRMDKQILGTIGEIHPRYLQDLGISQKVYGAELLLDDLLPLASCLQKTAPIPSFPGSERDWTVTVPEEVTASSLLEMIDQNRSAFLEQVYLLDLYKSQQIGQDKKNVTFRFFYRDQNKTIALETVEKEHAQLVAAVSKKLGI
ncbi:MAG: phenylalanine--tRNA ligase subunit beta [Chlamydiales bacterium]|nr:phenylalanine--tRNA ligase subunit beta [Chlamydiales bacterium]